MANTNPNLEGEWSIGGVMKVNRVLSDKEVKAINKKAGTSDLPRLSEVVSKRKGGKIMAGGLSNLKKSINIKLMKDSKSLKKSQREFLSSYLCRKEIERQRYRFFEVIKDA